LDCPVYKGNSGGPVVASVHSGLETKFRLIGIVSEFVPFEEKWINDKYGYATLRLVILVFNYCTNRGNVRFDKAV